MELGLNMFRMMTCHTIPSSSRPTFFFFFFFFFQDFLICSPFHQCDFHSIYSFILKHLHYYFSAPGCCYSCRCFVFVPFRYPSIRSVHSETEGNVVVRVTEGCWPDLTKTTVDYTTTSGHERLKLTQNLNGVPCNL